MLKLIDRLMVIAYFKAYLVCLVSLLSLYIVVDLFTNLDEFAHQHKGFLETAGHIGSYYGHQLAVIFDRLCEPIVLLAGMFTIAWMQRNNELIPLLSAGVSTRRVVLPVLLSACFMLGLAIVNQEFIVPRIADRLLVGRDDPGGDKILTQIPGAWEPNGININGGSASRKDKIVRDFSCVISPPITANLLLITAKEAHYLPEGSGNYQKGWMLIEAESKGLEGWNHPEILEVIHTSGTSCTGKYFLKIETADFDAVTRPANWVNFASTAHLYHELQRTNLARPALMAVLFHTRFTRTILGMILVFMGLSVILRDQNRNMFISAGLCLVLCGIFFAACFLSKQMGSSEFIPPALAAWLPVFCFGPLAFVMFDAVHT